MPASEAGGRLIIQPSHSPPHPQKITVAELGQRRMELAWHPDVTLFPIVGQAVAAYQTEEIVAQVECVCLFVGGGRSSHQQPEWSGAVCVSCCPVGLALGVCGGVVESSSRGFVFCGGVVSSRRSGGKRRVVVVPCAGGLRGLQLPNPRQPKRDQHKLRRRRQAAYDFGVRPQELALRRQEVAALEEEAANAGRLR